jgi:hypothetical protein
MLTEEEDKEIMKIIIRTMEAAILTPSVIPKPTTVLLITATVITTNPAKVLVSTTLSAIPSLATPLPLETTATTTGEVLVWSTPLSLKDILPIKEITTMETAGDVTLPLTILVDPETALLTLFAMTSTDVQDKTRATATVETTETVDGGEEEEGEETKEAHLPLLSPLNATTTPSALKVLPTLPPKETALEE